MMPAAEPTQREVLTIVRHGIRYSTVVYDVERDCFWFHVNPDVLAVGTTGGKLVRYTDEETALEPVDTTIGDSIPRLCILGHFALQAGVEIEKLEGRTGWPQDLAEDALTDGKVSDSAIWSEIVKLMNSSSSWEDDPRDRIVSGPVRFLLSDINDTMGLSPEQRLDAFNSVLLGGGLGWGVSYAEPAP